MALRRFTYPQAARYCNALGYPNVTADDIRTAVEKGQLHAVPFVKHGFLETSIQLWLRQFVGSHA